MKTSTMRASKQPHGELKYIGGQYGGKKFLPIKNGLIYLFQGSSLYFQPFRANKGKTCIRNHIVVKYYISRSYANTIYWSMVLESI